MSKYVIDTSSLISLAIYFVPFDEQKVLENFLRNQFETKNCILLKSVWEECKYTKRHKGVGSGLVKKTFPWLEKHIEKYEPIISGDLHTDIDNRWAVSHLKEGLSDLEYAAKKGKYIKSADFELIKYAIDKSNTTIITEESRSQNDNKLFKKIPTICNQRTPKINCENLVFLLKKLGLKVSFTVSET